MANNILTLLGITLDAYNNALLDEGTRWLNAQLAHDPEAAALLRRSDWFWSWWVTKWENRDRDLMRMHISDEIEVPFRDAWLFAHRLDGVQAARQHSLLSTIIKQARRSEV